MRACCPSCLDAAATDFVPAAKTHLPRAHLLRSPEQRQGFTLFNGLNAPPLMFTAQENVSYEFAPSGVEVVEDAEVVSARSVLDASVVTLNCDAAIEPIFTRAAELEKRGAAHSSFALAHEVGHATMQLDAPAVSKLIRVVKAWDAATSTFDRDRGGTIPVNNNIDAAGEETIPTGVPNNGSTFLPFLVDGQHRLLASRFGWYRSWSRRALATTLFGFKARDLLRALRKRRSELRVAAVRPSSTRVRKIVSQLARLANVVVPHAPPGGLDQPSPCTC